MSLLKQFSNLRHTLITLVLLAGVLCLGMTQFAWAEYPDKNIKVVLHVSPGGGTDTMARLVLRYVGEKLGTNFVIENHSGAGGQIGYTTLSMAPPDGYTIGTITTMSIVTHELTREGLAYTLRDNFTPIARVVMDASGVFVPADSPLKTLDDLIQVAKEEPGKLSWGGTMLWGAHHIHLALLEKAAGIKLTYVPFDGASESRAALLGGHLDAVAGGVSEFASQVKEGQLRGLALGGPKRSSLLPDVPTYKELGYDVEIGSNRGFAAPAGTPQEHIDILSNAFKEVMEDPAFLADAEKIGIAPTLNYMSAEDFRGYLLNLQDNMREMLKDAQK